MPGYTNVRETRRDNPEWTMQTHKTQDEDKIQENTTQRTRTIHKKSGVNS